MTSSQFSAQLRQEIDKAFWIFIGKVKPVNLFHAIRTTIPRLAYKVFGYRLYGWTGKNANLRAAIKHFDVKGLEELASWLGDDYSKQILIKLMVRNLFQGLVPFEPIVNRQAENAARERAKELIKKPGTYTVKMDEVPWTLNFYDLSSIGYPLSAHIHHTNITCTFLFEQYRYKRNGMNIGVEKGDIAIDGGGCWGDTALYMASQGAERVYCFEFSEENLKILDQNLAANPKLAEHISLVKKALWSEDGASLSFEAKGPATTLVNSEDGMEHAPTTTVDTLVEQMNIQRIDFIKMDIEGAEMNALRGARKTIERFRPKLAITVYHRPEDLFTIPQFIKSIRADYDFYLDHFTSGVWETVLFAVPHLGRTLTSQSRIPDAIDAVPVEP